MRIAVIAPTYLPSRRANTIQVMKMTDAMTAIGHDVHLIVPKPVQAREAIEPDWASIARHYGVTRRFPISWLPANPFLKSYDFGIRAVRFAAGLNTDLVFTRHPQAAALASVLGQRVILEVHDMPQGTLGPLLFRQFLRGRGAQSLVVISKALHQALTTRYVLPGRLFSLVAYDAVDLERYQNLPAPIEARAALGLPERFTVGYTGHLYPGRGIDIILRLARQIPGLTFLLVGGNDADIERVKLKCTDLPNVVLTGFVPNSELPRYQAASDILLMPYQQQVEASSGGDIAAFLSPMKLFEYLASGRAILSTNLPVFREILDTNNSVLLPPENLSAWQDAILQLQADQDNRHRLGQQAQNTAKQHTWQARAQKILEDQG